MKGDLEWVRTVGIVLSVLAAVAGLVILAGLVLSAMAMNSFGSNK